METSLIEYYILFRILGAPIICSPRLLQSRKKTLKEWIYLNETSAFLYFIKFKGSQVNICAVFCTFLAPDLLGADFALFCVLFLGQICI